MKEESDIPSEQPAPSGGWTVKSGDDENHDVSTASVTNGKKRTLLFIVAYIALLALAIALPTAIILSKNDDDSSDDGSSDSSADKLIDNDDDKTSTTTTERKYFVTDGAVNSTIELLSEDVVTGYATETELKAGLTQAALFVVGNTVYQYTDGCTYYGTCPGDKSDFIDEEEPGTEFDADGDRAPAPVAGVPEDTTTTTTMESGAAPKGDEDEYYGTNNQEKDVEEGDLIVSDGENVYGAFGDHLVIWKATDGEIVAKVPMPTMTEMEEAIKARYLKKRRSMSLPYYGGGGPNIVSLLLHEKRLLVLVNGYNQLFSPVTDRENPILYEYMGLHARLYDTTEFTSDSRRAEEGNPPSLRLVDWTNLNGGFNSIRAVNGTAHIVSQSGIDVYTDLIMPYQPNFYDENFSPDQFREDAKTASVEDVEAFVEELIEELRGEDGSIPDLVRVNLWQESVVGNVEKIAYVDGLMNNLVLVHSVDLMSESLGASSFTSTGVFTPSYDTLVYSSLDKMILASRVWEPDETTPGLTVESTVLLSLALKDKMATAHSTGKVKGYVMNSYSIDVHENILRIATSVQNRIFFVEPMMSDGIRNLDEPEPEESRTENYVFLLNMPEPNSEEPAKMVNDGFLTLGEKDELFTAVRFFDNIAYAVTFERKDPFYALDLGDSKNPKILGQIDDIPGFSIYLHPINAEKSLILALGQNTDDDGFVTGMMITIFDITIPTTPEIKFKYLFESYSEGWSDSESLYTFKATRYAAGRLIIPVDLSDFHGFQIFLADATQLVKECEIPFNRTEYYYPMPVDVIVEEPGVVFDDEEGSDSDTVSTANDTPEATPGEDGSGQGDTETGTVSIMDEPVTVTSNPDDKDVPIDSDMMVPPPPCNYCGRSLPQRSFMFGNTIMTTEGSTINLSELGDGECKTIWTKEIEIDDPEGKCCDYGGYYY